MSTVPAKADPSPVPTTKRGRARCSPRSRPRPIASCRKTSSTSTPSRTGGLLELAFPNGSKIVVNTQPPLQELWLAAQSGGFHFRSVGGRWIDGRDGGEFFAVLSACASAQAGRPLRFEP